MTIQTIIDGFYEEICARIKDQVPDIKHVDLYYGQYDKPMLDENNNPVEMPFNRPAIFFEWPDEILMQPLGLRRKYSNVLFSIHLVQDVIQEVDQRTPTAIRQKGHKHLALINTLQNALERYNGDQATDFKHFGPIAFVGLKPYAIMGAQTVHILGFRVRIINDAATKFYTKLSDLTPPVDADDDIANDIEQL